jgi:tRNA-specific 2-thiouridylase
LINHKKKDSTGICFIGERKFKTFLSEYLPAQPGEIESVDGQKIGTHDGLMFYTMGQRQGLKIGGLKDSTEAPWYVSGKNAENNILIVAQGHDHPALFARSLIAKQVHWINGLPEQFPIKMTAKTRYRQTDQACIINKMDADNTENGCYQIVFDEPQRAITPGQSVVFYEGETCLGGGIIVDAEK